MYYQQAYFGQNIRHLRESGGYSYTETAKALHTTVKTLKLIESGTIPPRVSLEMLWHAASFFSVPAVCLILQPQNSETMCL